MATYAKIGSKKILLDAVLGDDPEMIREHLRTTFPELANSQIRRKEEGEDTVIEFTARAGRKG